jgi:hypothetical protein
MLFPHQGRDLVESGRAQSLHTTRLLLLSQRMLNRWEESHERNVH